MTLGRVGCRFTVLAVLCVLTIFFFPATHGPYSAVHGPATALQAARAAAYLLIGMAIAALNELNTHLPVPPLILYLGLLSVLEFRLVGRTPSKTVLRC